MKVSVSQGTRTAYHYAFKDRISGEYIIATWRRDAGVETCGWYEKQRDFAAICQDQARAQGRYAAFIKLVESQLDRVMQNPPSRWRTENAHTLSRWLNGDLVLVRACVTVTLDEQVLP